jgi:predicted ATPase
VAILGKDAGEVETVLDALVGSEALTLKRQGGEIEYEFRHALPQQMAHDSMIGLERRAMHARIASVLERQVGISALPETLAHHLTVAGSYNEAVASWLNAGVQASRRSAHREAIDHFRRGLSLIRSIKDLAVGRRLELSLLVSLFGSLTVTERGTSQEVSRGYARGLALCEQELANPLVFAFLTGQFTFANCRGRTEEAQQHASALLSIADGDASGKAGCSLRAA